MAKYLPTKIHRLVSFVDTFGAKLTVEKVLHKYSKRMEISYYKDIQQYLYTEVVQPTLGKQPKPDFESSHISPTSTIWTMWWQGENTMPAIISSCIASMREHQEHHNIVLITEKNLKEYLQIPTRILEKFNNGSISFSMFSDLIRSSLLCKYGGIWIDSTMYMTSSLDQAIYDYSFFSVRRPGYIPNSPAWSDRWTTYFLASTPSSEPLKSLERCLFAYWANHDYQIDYFLTDCMLHVLYDHYPYIRELIDSVPANNQHVLSMYRYLSDKADSYDQPADTYLNKLSYKLHLSPTTPNGELSLYGKLLKSHEETTVLVKP